MSCLLFWCRRVHNTDSDTDCEDAEEIKSRKKEKKKKKKRCGDVCLPVGLESGRPSAPTEAVVSTGPPVQDLTGQTEEDVGHLQKVLLDDVADKLEQRENGMKTPVVDEAAAEPTADLMSTSVQDTQLDVVSASVQSRDELQIASEAIKKLLNIQQDPIQSEHLDGAQPTKMAEDGTTAEDQLDDTLPSFDLSLVNKMMSKMVTVLKAAEGKTDAILGLLSLSVDLEDSVGDTMETPLDKMLIASQAKREAIRELLNVQLDQIQSEHLDGAHEDDAKAADQLDNTLACFDRSLVNKVMRMMATVVKAADAETDAILDLLSFSVGLEDSVGDRVETPLGKEETTELAEAQADAEQVDRVLDISGGSSTTPLEDELLIASEALKKLLNIQQDPIQSEHLEDELKIASEAIKKLLNIQCPSPASWS